MTLGPRTPDISSLDLFVDAVHRGSISSAAAAAGISQPSASARIRKLERQLGVDLVERTTSGVRPTAVGRVVAGWAADVVDAMAQLQAGVDALDARPGASLHVAASFTIAEMLLPTWLAKFRVQAPGVQTTLEVKNSTDVEDMVERGAVHLGFVEGPRVSRPLRSQVLADDELVVVVAPAHRWSRRRRPLSVDDLLSESLVLRETGSGTREALLAALSTAQAANIRVAMEAGSTSSVLRAVIDGVGPTVISRLAIVSDVAAGRLCEVPITGISLGRQLRAVWSPSGDLSQSATALLRIAKASVPAPLQPIS